MNVKHNSFIAMTAATSEAFECVWFMVLEHSLLCFRIETEEMAVGFDGETNFFAIEIETKNFL